MPSVGSPMLSVYLTFARFLALDEYQRLRTKMQSCELRYRTLLINGAREVRFERVVSG